MEVKVQAIHFEVSQQLIDFINKKAEKLARRYSAVTDFDVNLKVVKPETSMNKEVMMKVLIPQEEFVATKVADTFEEAVDLSLEAVERQLEKRKNAK